METYHSLYKNEVRAIEITIDDNDGSDFVPSAAYVQVLDEDGNTVVSEQAALVSLNTVATAIGVTVTATVGNYKIVWRILHSTHTYYHITNLEVQDW